jgi:NitT/TauT family transport system ATP-binding protein
VSASIFGRSLDPERAVTAAPSVVSLRGVAKTFGNGVKALGGIDLDVRDREFVSLLGPSGCGKSTALRIVAGLTEPSSGIVIWRDRDAAGHNPAGEIGFVFQDPTLMPWANVAGNVHLPLKLQGVSFGDAAAAIDAALARVGLSDFAQAYPRELSGGMKMRVSIARALVTRPKLLLMDEPFAALDEITRFKLNNDLLSLWQSMDGGSGTVLFVTHSVFESVFLSNRILVMTSRPGRIFTEIAIDEPYPRAESFRTSASYAAYCRKVSDALHEGMKTGAAA